MPSVVQRFTSNKFIFITGLIIGCYLLLRAIAYYQHQDFSFSGNYFSYEGKQVRYLCQGQGKPYVFFETGFGSDSEQSWNEIVQSLPSTFTACYYDRLGHGGSDNVPTTFSTEQKSQLQAALIQHIAGDQPVILVAHSYGGIIARRTAANAKINLAALILLDSAHENQHGLLQGKLEPIAEYVKVWHYLDAVLGVSAIKNMFKTYTSATSKRLDQYYASLQYAQVLSTYRNEKGFYTPLAQFNYDFGDLRLLVLSHDSATYANNPRFFKVTNQWQKMQTSIAKLSSNSEHIIVKGATHNIPADAPEVVISKILETVDYVAEVGH
ncbi:alpha/beta fold hydrolase [Paraglaciecola aestuariivivens]